MVIQAGASRGRLVDFKIVHDWGTSTAALDSLSADPSATLDWTQFLMFSLLPLAASVYFGARNLKLGRGDRRGATRIAVFVFVMNILEAAFTTRLAEDGVLAAGWDWVAGRAFGHSLMHSVSMWFAYIALEPYVRRLWPRILVSWARLVSGRVRDPLVGRDLLIGAVSGTSFVALGTLVEFAAQRLGIARVPTSVTGGMLESVTSIPITGLSLAYAGSVCVLQVLETLVLVLVLRLLLRRTWLAVLISALLLATTTALGSAPTTGWLIAIMNGVIFLPGMILVLMRFGLLSGVASVFAGLVMGAAVASLDLSSWYADRALVSIAVLVAILVYGAATALGGKPIFGDPLRETPAR